MLYGEMDSVEQVKALQLEADNAEALAAWAHAVVVEEIDAFDSNIKSPGLNVLCGNTVKRASLGDWIIKHKDGTYDVKGPLYFLAHYEAIR